MLASRFCSGCGSPTSVKSEAETKSARFSLNLDNLNKPAENSNDMPVWLKQGIFWFAIVSLAIVILQAIGGGGV